LFNNLSSGAVSGLPLNLLKEGHQPEPAAQLIIKNSFGCCSIYFSKSPHKS
jgi:hypothetical protein